MADRCRGQRRVADRAVAADHAKMISVWIEREVAMRAAFGHHHLRPGPLECLGKRGDALDLMAAGSPIGDQLNDLRPIPLICCSLHRSAFYQHRTKEALRRPGTELS